MSEISPPCIHCGGWKCRNCQPQLYAEPGEQGSTAQEFELEQLREDWRVMKLALQNILGTELLPDAREAAHEARGFARKALTALRMAKR